MGTRLINGSYVLYARFVGICYDSISLHNPHKMLIVIVISFKLSLRQVNLDANTDCSKASCLLMTLISFLFFRSVESDSYGIRDKYVQLEQRMDVRVNPCSAVH